MTMTHGEIVRYAEAGGRRNIGVRFDAPDAPTVLITPAATPDGQAQAEAFALDIALTISGLRQQIFAAEIRTEAARDSAARARAKAGDLEERLRRACGERAGYAAGAFYAREAEGAVWLLGDFAKGWSAFGLRFDSWADLASERPELRPVGCGHDATGTYVTMMEVALEGAAARALEGFPS